MEIIRGKQISFMDTAALAEQRAQYERIHMDIGTGDGRFVQHIAQNNPHCFAIGVDACRANLSMTRRAPTNTLFVIANAQALPSELYGLAAHITINFPWGSLIEGLLAEDRGLLAGLNRIARPDATLSICLNSSALREVGWSLEAGAGQVQTVLSGHGFRVRPPLKLQSGELRSYPTTWAKRLAFGRDPRAVCIHATKKSGSS